MHHKPILLTHVSLFLPHKTCFEDFSTQIHYGNRIALIGSNGSGKSSLLKILFDKLISENINFGYVPQIIETEKDNLSGGERFNKALSTALSGVPHMLLFDEPTNHLDSHNRKSFLKMLQGFSGTLIIASHDVELLRHNIDIFWHIDKGKVNIFSGNYQDYINQRTIQQSTIEQEVMFLKKQKKEMHHILMKEQERAAKSRSKGEKNIEQRKWPTVVSKTKVGRANQTAGKIKASIVSKKESLIEGLANYSLPEIIKPNFNLKSACESDRVLVAIKTGMIWYKNHNPILNHIEFSMNTRDRVLIMGNNASGKSTLVKAIMGMPQIGRSGEWFGPRIEDIGYLDQHYQNFNQNKTVFDIINECVPAWESTQIRRFLSDFLFRKNDEVNLVAKYLSGGEKARLSLALIALNTPKLLILDEMTNNLDLVTREYVIQALKNYPGAMIIISHDEDFIQKINISDRFLIRNSRLEREPKI